MKRAYTNGILLDGTEQMQPVAHKILLTEDDKITAIADEGVDLDGYEVIDLHGSYIMPGLVNLHVHLAGNGKPSAKPRDNAALVRKILSNGLTRAVAYRLVCSYAKLELLGGVTTIRTVGGIADFDTRCRDDAAAGRLLAPRILAANGKGQRTEGRPCQADDHRRCAGCHGKGNARRAENEAGDGQSRLRRSPQAGLHRSSTHRIAGGRKGGAGKWCGFHRARCKDGR